MSDLNVSNIPKNSLFRKQPLTHPAVFDSAGELDKNAYSNSSSVKFASSKCNAKNSEETVSPGTEVHASTLSENEDCTDVYNYSTDDIVIFDPDQYTASVRQSSKNSITDDSSLYISKATKSPKTHVLPSGGTKYNVGFPGPSSSNKTRNSSNFNIFGQLLNKKPSSSYVSRSSGSPNAYPQSVNSRQYSPTHVQNREDPSSESSEGVQRTQVKTKLRSMWNNMKYGWRMKREVHLKTDSAIWLLGQCYHNKLSDGSSLSQDVTEQLRLDLLSKIWLTYRMNFPAIPGTNLISDSGWGCMLRCGQMMIAQAFVCHFLERDWRLCSDQPEAKNQLYKMILRWFGDSLSDKSPFSLHHLVSLGENYGRKAGDWYGPTHAAHVLRDALVEAKKTHPHLEQLCMYVASDGIVFKQDVMDLCMDSASQEENHSLSSFSSDFANISLAEVQGNSSNETAQKENHTDFIGIPDVNEKERKDYKSFENSCPSYSEYGPPSYGTVKSNWKSLILFVSVRLGNDRINPFYIPCLKSLLAYDHCIGIIGGRPKHALYFIGWQDDKIIHMDPHSCQPAIDVEKEDFNEKSFHSSSVRTMSFSEMDPSCAIGFYFREMGDFLLFIEKFSEITAPLKRNLEYPVFALAEGKRAEIEDEVQPDGRCIYSHMSISPNMDEDDEDDDYILL